MISNNHPSQEDIICAERIRQAHWGFNLAFAFASTSFAVTLFGLFLLLTGQISKGAYATVGGFASTAVGACCMQISRDANDRLDHLREKPDCQSSSPNSDVEDTEGQPFKAALSHDGNDLSAALEKLEDKILLDVQSARE